MILVRAVQLCNCNQAEADDELERAREMHVVCGMFSAAAVASSDGAATARAPNQFAHRSLDANWFETRAAVLEVPVALQLGKLLRLLLTWCGRGLAIERSRWHLM